MLTAIKSWRTTLIGVLTFAGVVINNLLFGIDFDETTHIDIDAILIAAGVMAQGWFSRDNKTTDEQAGAK